MTLLKEIEYKEGVKIALWQIDLDNNDTLNQPKASKVEKEKLRQKQCVAHTLDGWGIEGNVVYDAYGKPHLSKGSMGISISHSFQYLVIGVGIEQKLGIDLEKIDRPFEKLAHKFVTDKEMEWVKGTEDLALIWSAKEALYKVYGRKNLDFKKHLAILKKEDPTTLTGQIAKNGMQLQLPVFYEEILNGFILTRVGFKRN